MSEGLSSERLGMSRSAQILRRAPVESFPRAPAVKVIGRGGGVFAALDGVAARRGGIV